MPLLTSFLAVQIQEASSLLEYDPKMSLADGATALGVLGAAIGYVISLCSGWREARKNNRDRGTKLAIVELLERGLPSGISESELRRLYDADAQLRKKYAAWDPKSIDDVSFERHIKQLQFYDRAVDLISPGTFRLRHEPISAYEYEQTDRVNVSEFVRSEVPIQLLRETALRIISESDNKFAKREAAETLMRMRDSEGLRRCVEILKDKDHEAAAEMLDAIVRMMHFKS